MPTRINSLSQLKGLSDKRACLVATVGDIAFTGITQIDGVTLSNEDRVLVWQQSTPSQNGIYILSGSTNLVRALDSKNVNDFIQGTQYLVVSGNTYSETLFYLKNKVTTLGVDNIIIDIFGGLNGTSGSSGSSGSSGTSGTSGVSGSSGTSGAVGPPGPPGAPGSSAGITSYTNPADNRVITSVSSTEINAEANLTFDGSILDVNTTAAFKLPVGTTAERPISPLDGLIRLNTSLKSLEFFYNSAWANIMSANMLVEYLVIAGGGGKGNPGSIGGGAGGYKSSVYGEKSGGEQNLQSTTDMQMPLFIVLGTPYEVVIGAGAASVGLNTNGVSGSPSSFHRIFCLGGGGATRASQSTPSNSGGSGGGHSDSRYVGLGTASQGHNGSTTAGGGAGGIGSSTVENSIESSITGTPIKRAAGGGSLNAVYAPNLGTGSGGAAGSGGWSGVVILRYSAALTLTNSTGGLTFSTNTIGNYKVTTFTAGAGNIQFNF